MKKILIIFTILVFLASCKNASTVIDDNNQALETMQLGIAVQGGGEAKLKLTAVGFSVEKLLSEIDGKTVAVPLGAEITAKLTPAYDDEDVPAVFWYGSAVASVDKNDVLEPSIAFTLKKKATLGIFIDSRNTDIELNSVVIDLAPATGSVIVFDKTNRVGPLTYNLPTGFSLDLLAKNFGNYKFQGWESGSQVLSTLLKFKAEIKSATNIKPVFTKDSSADVIENFTFNAGANGTIEVVVKNGDVVESTTIILASQTTTVPINLKRFEDGSVTATAKPNSGYIFDSWENADGETTTTLKVLSSMANIIRANFKTATLNGRGKEPLQNPIGTYLITDLAEFTWVIEQSAANNTFSGKTIKLEKNFDLNNTEFSGIYPSGTFAGTFDGNNKRVDNVKIVGTAGGTNGFIGTIGNGAVVKDLEVKGAITKTGTASSGTTGGIIGVADKTYTLQNLTSRVNITDNTINSANGGVVGGIVGYTTGNNSANSTMTALTNYGSITTTAATVGGIVGYDNSGMGNGTGNTMRYVHNEGNITVTVYSEANGKNYGAVGGIAGALGRDIEFAKNKGTITANARVVGGIVGESMPSGTAKTFTIKKSVNMGNLIGNSTEPAVWSVSITSGGVVGGIVGAPNLIGTIEDCYNLGSISGLSPTKSGVVGMGTSGNSHLIKTSYSLGAITGGGTMSAIARLWNDTSSTYTKITLTSVYYIGTLPAVGILVGSTSYSAAQFSSLPSSFNASIWGVKYLASVNGVTTRPYIIGLE